MNTIMDVHQGPAFVVSLCGCRWNGVQQGLQPSDALAVFTDPVTRSTLALPLNEVTVGNVWRAVRKKRAEFLMAMDGDGQRSRKC